MLQTLFAMSLATAFGFMMLLLGAPRLVVLRLLGAPFILDAAGTVFMFWMHWGTFSGIMVATFAAGMWSTCVRFARWWIGYVEGNRYYFGVRDGRPIKRVR
jgi:hypothetical protein